MSKKLILSALLVLGLVGMVMAEEPKPVQLAVFNPVQMVPKTESIKGVSLGLIYAANKDVTGFSFVLLGVNEVTGDGKGVQWGLGNWVDGLFYGWQDGFVNHAGTRFIGFQDGVVNVTEGDLTGVQLGAVNWTEGYVHGAQAGVTAHACRGGQYLLAVAPVHLGQILIPEQDIAHLRHPPVEGVLGHPVGQHQGIK